MALSTLKYNGHRGSIATTPQADQKGVPQFNGQPSEFYNWEFRARAELAGTKKDDRPLVAPRLIKGLSGDALAVARDVGLTALTSEDGFEKLVAALKQHLFPLTKDEARELLVCGQSKSSVLSRQTGEPMASYIQRRKRWWQTVKTLDPKVEMSQSLLGDYLLEHSGLSKLERLLILTTTRNSTEFDAVSEALLHQHSLRHLDDHNRHGPRWGKGYTANLAEATNDPAELDDSYMPPEWGYKDVIDRHDDDDTESQAYDDEFEEAQLEALVGLLDEYDEFDLTYEVVQAEATAYFAKRSLKGKGKGKGKGKPSFRKGQGKGSGLSLEDRRKRLAALKERSTCKACGRKGHWSGDAACPKR